MLVAQVPMSLISLEISWPLVHVFSGRELFTRRGHDSATFLTDSTSLHSLTVVYSRKIVGMFKIKLTGLLLKLWV